MSTAIGGKLWLLQHEDAIESLAKHPTWAVATIASLYKLPKADLQTWLDTHNGGDRNLEPARITAVKRELGILSEGRAGRAPDSAPNAPAREAPPPPKPPAPKPEPTRGAKYARPWLEKRWRGDGFNHWRPVLVLLAAQPHLAISKAAGSPADVASFRQFKATWLGSGELSAPQLEEFIRFGDSRANPANSAPQVPEKPVKAAAAPAAPVERPPAAIEPAPRVAPPPVVEKPAAAEEGILLRFEITVRLVPEGEGAR